MLQPSANFLISAALFASGALCVGADTAGRSRAVYVAKPLTMVFALALALQRGPVTTSYYQAWLVVGLLFSLAGDVFLMLPSDRFAAGLGSFLVAHLCYVAAFSDGVGLGGAPETLLPLLAFAAIVLWLVLPRAGRLALPVGVYVAAIVAMAFQALSRWLATGEIAALLAALGALLFVLSDASIAIRRFVHPFAGAQALILSTYFTAQWLIALSVGVGEDLLDRAIR